MNNAITSDDFDPDRRDAGYLLRLRRRQRRLFDASDTPYVPGSNDPALAPTHFVTVFVVNDIPGERVDGQLGISRLTAESRTGTGAAGTTFAGQGNGSWRRRRGRRRRQAPTRSDSSYVVSGVSVTATKTQTVVDQFGGSRPVPGARINYSIAVSATGSGTATNAVFTDNIPANTTYVPGSLASTPWRSRMPPTPTPATTRPHRRARVSVRARFAQPRRADTQTITFAVTIN